MNKRESKVLMEVLEWKEEAYKVVEHLKLKKALKNRISSSVETADRPGFKTVLLSINNPVDAD